MISRARQERDDDLEERVGNAIEMAILGKAKRFIKSAAVQKIINSIWSYAEFIFAYWDSLLISLTQREMCLPSAK